MVVGAVLFLPAGTLRFWEAWVYMAVLFLPMTGFALRLILRHPQLLERRMRTKESRPEQRRVIVLSSLVLLVTFLVPGLDERYGLSSVPAWLVLCADALVLSGYALFIATLNANEYASRVVEVEERQHLASRGPYALVRHPLYVAMLLIVCCTPLALGSYWALIPAALFPPLLVTRIANEEEMLLRDLEGYEAYRAEVPYRLIPGLW